MKEQKKVLVIGSGGREDALVALISRSPLVSQIYCAPGNDGIGQRPKTHCLPKLKADDLWGLRDFAKRNKIDLTVVGPEAPLVAGIVDGFEAVGLKIVGPTKEAAQIEGSKVFAKEFMERHKIPTADFMVFDDPEKARKYATANLPCVIKADGLTGGKGAIPCKTEEEIALALKRIMIDKEFKESGNRVVVEEFLTGEEATFMVLTDGWTAIPLLSTQDHKPVFDGDQGPNTGGMGAYAPAPVITKELEKRIMAEIIEPTLDGMKAEGRPYKGCLYAGLMITLDGQPKVLEFNCRFGDPELQPLVLLMESDIVPILLGITEGRLPVERIKWVEGAAVCVVMTSKGYPGTPEIGKEIKGLAGVAKLEDVEVFHAGTKKENGKILTAGGRVIGPTAMGKDIPEAIQRVYEAVTKISWSGEHHRPDIGKKALKHGIQLKMGL
ncbi:TPA: phosphoribosylamine--glycine ligase [bacterium]|nr:phosphoribosylamine--glycine ligase [bacterium]